MTVAAYRLTTLLSYLYTYQVSFAFQITELSIYAKRLTNQQIPVV